MPSFDTGSEFGNFRIVSKLGAGAMGQVYLAEDLKLGRRVAIKIVSEELSKDPELMARFEREAKTLAGMDHPNIGVLYDFQENDGVRFLVLQLVEGDTLEDLIARGPIPVEEALPIFIQTAYALEAAHALLVVHRDLKPGNIKITPEGIVKVLDFGLAKRYGEEKDPALYDSSIGSGGALTQRGAVIGTPFYMSPEQVRTKNVDKRTDIWAFGCTLYESLTGKRPFISETPADLMVSILRDTPDWSILPSNVPESVRSVLRRCLERDIRKRLKDAGDIAITFEEALETLKSNPVKPVSVASGVPSHPKSASSRLFPGMVVGLLVILAGTVFWGISNQRALEQRVISEQPEAEPKVVKRFSIALDPNYPIKRPNPVIGDKVLAISRDGLTLVYVSEKDGQTQLIRRQVGELEAHVIDGSEGAWSPFISYDGKWVGYQSRDANATLRKVPINGGVPISLDSVNIPIGGSWSEDGWIYFSKGIGSPIHRISDKGGESKEVTTLNKENRESLHGYPQIHQGSKTILFGTGPIPPHADHANLVIYSFESQKMDLIAQDIGMGSYVSSGHVIYAKKGSLMAVPYDLDLLTSTGPVVPVTESRMVAEDNVPRNFAVSGEGTLVYIPVTNESERVSTLVWVDREGNKVDAGAPARPYSSVRISPDGKYLALDQTDLQDVWIHELETGATKRLTFDFAHDYRPIWMPDGKSILFLSTRGDSTSIYRTQIDGAGNPDMVYKGDRFPYPEAVTPDGSTLVYAPVASKDPVSSFALDGNAESEIIFEGNFEERNIRISPDGSWISYESNESGEYEIYVQSFPELGSKRQISSDGGENALWNPKGGEMFYWEGDRLMVVDITTDSSFNAGDPKELFEMTSSISYDVSPDGERFLVIEEGDKSAWATELIVVENWFVELNEKVQPTISGTSSEVDIVEDGK